LERPGLPREKVLATVVRLLEETRIRIGNERYRKLNRSYGLTTLRNRHLQVHGASLRFQFKGKSGKQHSVTIADRRLVRIVRRCARIPGQELFQYLDDAGEPRRIASEDVNAYLREIAGGEFTAKYFRTWAGTVLALRYLRDAPLVGSPGDARTEIAASIARVAVALGNTPAVCRKCYVHPAISEAYAAGRLPGETAADPELAGSESSPYALTEEEQAVLELIRAHAVERAPGDRDEPPRRQPRRAA
jgi:DNA topoisomerase-1